MLATGDLQLFGGFSQNVPAIGANAAYVPLRAHASVHVIIPPAENPVAIIRLVLIANFDDASLITAS